jgi:DNA-binding NtrC family response regulator
VPRSLPCGFESRHGGVQAPTIVVLHEHAGVLELIEAALRDRGAHVLATLDPFEAMEAVRQLKVDVLVSSRELNDVARDLQASQPGLSVVVLDDEPMSLAEIVDAAAVALERDRNRHDSA